VITELDIQCLAEQLPEFLTVDLSATWSRARRCTWSDIKLDSHIKVVTHGQARTR
jgi:large subunit ribosomal protein L25